MLVWTRETVPAELPKQVADLYQRLLPYIESLTEPHKDRPGAKCPKMPAALRHRRVYFVPASLNEQNIDVLIQHCIAHMEEHAKPKRVPAASVIFFPETTSASELLEIRRRLVEHVRSQGYSMGVAHPESDMIGVHGGYPFRSPVKMLVMRDIVLSDIEHFIKRRSLLQALRFLRHYEKKMRRMSTRESDTWIQHARAARWNIFRRVATLIGITIVALSIVTWLLL